MDTRGYEFTSDRNGNVYVTRVPQPWRVIRIDRLLDDITREIRRREHGFLLNEYSAKSWSKAWDKHPELHTRHDALIRLRYKETQYRDRMAEKVLAAEIRRRRTAFARESRRQFEASKCPTCGQHTLNNLARAA